MSEVPDRASGSPGERWLPLAISAALLVATLVFVVVAPGDGTDVVVTALLPLLLAARVGWHAWNGRDEWDREEVRQITGWIVAGGAVMLLVGSWFGVLERVLEIRISVGIAILTSVAAGALLGMQVGRYGVRARRKVAEATRARVQQRHAERSRERIALLNRIIRHHMRNAVSVIGVSAEMAAEHVGEDGEHHLEEIDARSADLLDKVETFQRISETLTGAVPIGQRDLATELQTALDDFREEYPDVAVSTPDGGPPVEVQANDLLQRVFYSQLENAVEHNDSPEPTVEVSVHVDADAGTATVRVADDGPGIPEDRKHLVFEAGDRGRTTEGDGLELFLANALVEQYGGTIRVQDNDPRGTVFETVLPQAGAEVESLAREPPDADELGTGTPRRLRQR